MIKTIKLGLISSVVLGFCIGCSSSVKADQVLSCYVYSSVDDASFTATVEVTYNEAADQAISATVVEDYTGLEKNDTNNHILQAMLNKQSIFDEIDGVDIAVEISDTSFAYKEVWQYQDVDLDQVVEVDPTQATFIEDQHYSLKKLKASYENEGYACSSEAK